MGGESSRVMGGRVGAFIQPGTWPGSQRPLTSILARILLPWTSVKYDSMPGFSLTSLLTVLSQWWVLLETIKFLIISYDCAVSRLQGRDLVALQLPGI